MSTVEVNKFVAEFVGTFVFLGVILSTRNPLSIGIALVAVIYLFSSVSGGNFNPAVSAMLYANKELTGMQLTSYVVAQVLGGLCAWQWFKHVKKTMLV